MVSNPNKNLKIIYPEETGSIISTLLEKYGLKESEEEFLEKIKQGKKPLGQVIAKIIKEVVENEISVESLPSVLRERLDIPKEKTEKLAGDIKKEILDLVKKVPIEEEVPVPEEEEISLPKKPIVEKPEIKPSVPSEKPEEKLEEKPSEKPRKQDIYREPIE